MTHETIRETPRKQSEADDRRVPTPRPPGDLDRTGIALRWAAVLIGLAGLVAIVVLAVTSDAGSEPELAADSLVIVDGSQLAPRTPEGFAPTGWEQPSISLVQYDASTRAALLPQGYAPSGWQTPEITVVVANTDAVRLILPEGFVPTNN